MSTQEQAQMRIIRGKYIVDVCLMWNINTDCHLEIFNMSRVAKICHMTKYLHTCKKDRIQQNHHRDEHWHTHDYTHHSHTAHTHTTHTPTHRHNWTCTELLTISTRCKLQLHFWIPSAEFQSILSEHYRSETLVSVRLDSRGASNIILLGTNGQFPAKLIFRYLFRKSWICNFRAN